jgi:hypothetical protein
MMMTTWNNRASWAVAMALAAGVSTGASAADLGGNCCADLEERIAELEATTARKGNRKVSLEISGWLNKSILFWDDSIRRDAYFGIDNDAAETRFRFTGRAVISPDVTAGFVYEFGNHGSQSNLVDQTNGGDDRGFSSNTRLRQANVWIESKRLGRVTLGVASQATDGIAEIDLSRSEVVSGSAVDTWIGGFIPVVNGAYDPGRLMYFHFLGNFDGGRDQLIRYDSPTIGGFIFSASYSGKFFPEAVPGAAPPPPGPHKPEWDVALRYAAEWNGFRFATGIGYHEGEIVDGTGGPGVGGAGSVLDRLPYNKKVVGSGSLLHVPSGLFLTGAAGWMKNLDSYVFPEGDEIRYYYVKGGVLANLFPIGQTTIYGEYYRMEKDLDTSNLVVWYPGLNAASQVYGVGIVQHIDGAAMELYAAYRYYDAPNGIDVFSGLREDYASFHMGQVGMRIKF